jgi:uncharacterized membrane protein
MPVSFSKFLIVSGRCSRPSSDVQHLGLGLAGMVLWAVFAFWAHGALFGVKPFGG